MSSRKERKFNNDRISADEEHASNYRDESDDESPVSDSEIELEREDSSQASRWW